MKMDIDPPQPAETNTLSKPEPDTEKPLPSSSGPSPNYQLRAILSGHKLSISAIKFSPDGSMLASAGE